MIRILLSGFVCLCFILNSYSQVKIVNYTTIDTFKLENGFTEYFVRTSDSDSYWLSQKENLVTKQFKTDSGLCYSIDYKGLKRVINLDKEKIVYKTPEIAWANDDYLCIHTFSDLAVGYDLLVPYKTKEPYFFKSKDIRGIDKKSNTLLYVDTITNTSITYVLYSLVTKQEKKISVNIEKEIGFYPFYKSILLENNGCKIDFYNKQYILELNEK